MNKVNLSLSGIIIFLLAISLLSQAEKVLWQKKLDSPICQISFNDNLVVASQKEVVYFDQNGENLQKFPLKENQFASLSKNGEVFAIGTHRPHVKEIIEKIELFNQKGKLLSTIKENGFPFLSPDGSWLIVVNRFKNEVSFFNKEGEFMGRHQFNDLRGLSLAFSDDSRYLLVNIPNRGKGKTSGFLTLFDKNGKELWRYEHPGSTTGQIAISKDGKIILFSSEKGLYSLNRKGRLNWGKTLKPGGILISLSANARYIALSRREDNSISLLKAKDGSLIWKKEIPGFDGYNSPFTSINVTDEGLIVATISKSWSLKNDKSYLCFLKDKKILSQSEFSQQSVKAEISKSNHNIILIAKNNLVIYRDSLMKGAD